MILNHIIKNPKDVYMFSELSIQSFFSDKHYLRDPLEKHQYRDGSHSYRVRFNESSNTFDTKQFNGIGGILNYLIETKGQFVFFNRNTIRGDEVVHVIIDEKNENNINNPHLKDINLEEFPLLYGTYKEKHRFLISLRLVHNMKNQSSIVIIHQHRSKYSRRYDMQLNNGDYIKDKYMFNIVDYESNSKYLRFLILLDQRSIVVTDFTILNSYSSNLESFYNFDKLKFISGNYPIGGRKKSETQLESEILTQLISNYQDGVSFSISEIEGDEVVHVFLDPDLYVESISNYPRIEFKNGTKILFTSFRIKDRKVQFVSYKDFVNNPLDENYKLNDPVDSFFLINNDFYSNDRITSILFYNDERKVIQQLSLFEVQDIPCFKSVRIEKKGLFYYRIYGSSSRLGVRYLVDEHTQFWFEYDFKNREILGLISKSEEHSHK